jgi:methyl-accepting chemotaxis protein
VIKNWIQKMKLGTKINFMLVTSILVVITILSIIVYRLSYNILVTSLGSRAEEIAAITSATINIQDMQSYKTEADTQKPSYKEITDKLSYMRKVSGSKYLYVMRKNEKGQFEYVIDASEKPAKIGDVEKTYSEFDEVYKGELVLSKSIDVDEYGTTISAFAPIKDGNLVIGFVGVDYDVAQGYADLQRLGKIIVVVSIVISIISIFASMLFSRRLVKPLYEMSMVAKKVSDYDLGSIYKVKVKNRDEIGILAEAVNMMIDNMISMIKNIKSSAEVVNENIKVFTKIVGSTNSAVEDVAGSMNQIAASTSKQTDEISSQTEEINKLAESIETVSSGIKGITGVVQNTELLYRNGINTVSQLVNKWEESTSARGEFVSIIQEVSKNSEDIAEIITTIKGIAVQTNLLALNASIEAARAGEYGRGFSVVAEEIRKLAEQSAQSTKDIGRLIEVIQNTAQKAVVAMNVSEKIGEEQNQIISDTEKIFIQFSNNINTMSKEVQTIELQNTHMGCKKDEILSSAESVLRLAEENTAYIEQTTASSEEVFSTIGEFKEQVENLNNLVHSLNNEVERFKV